MKPKYTTEAIQKIFDVYDLRLPDGGKPEMAQTDLEYLFTAQQQEILDVIEKRVIGKNATLFGHGEDWEGGKYQNELKDEQRKTLEVIRKELK